MSGTVRGMPPLQVGISQHFTPVWRREFQDRECKIFREKTMYVQAGSVSFL